MATTSKSKRILITGASRGIGRETARKLARCGHTVVLAARSEAALRALAEEITAQGGRAEVLPLDASDDASVARAARTLLEGGPCDVIVNNAAQSDQREFLLQPFATQRAEMELNYFGPLRLVHALLPAMLAARSGHIVNVSSLLGVVPTATMASYCATKAALEAWSHALRSEVARFGVKVTIFVAPHTETEMGTRQTFDGVHMLPASYVASELVRAVERAPRKYAASPVYRVLLRLARLFPLFMEGRVGSSVKRLLSSDLLAARAKLGAERTHQNV